MSLTLTTAYQLRVALARPLAEGVDEQDLVLAQAAQSAAQVIRASAGGEDDGNGTCHLCRVLRS